MSVSQFRSNSFQVTNDSLCIFGLMVKVCPEWTKIGYCEGCGAVNDCNMNQVSEDWLGQKCLKLADVLETHRRNGNMDRVATIVMSHMMLTYLFAGNEISFESFRGEFEAVMDIPRHRGLKVVGLPSVNLVNYGLVVKILVCNSTESNFGEASFVFLDDNNKLIA